MENNNNNILDMLKCNKDMIATLDKLSATSKPDENVEQWLSDGCDAIKNISAFSFDRIKELLYGSEVTSCDALFYSGDESTLNYLIEFKKTNLIGLKEFCEYENSNKKSDESINRKIRDSAKVLKSCIFDDVRDGIGMVNSTHIVVVYAEDGKIPVYMDVKNKKDNKKRFKNNRGRKSAVISEVPMAIFLQSSISGKKNTIDKIKNNLGDDAQKNSFSSSSAKKEKDKLVQMLSTTAKNTHYSIGKKNYVTLLNKKEFQKVIRKRLDQNEKFVWDWGKFKKYFCNDDGEKTEG